MPVAESVLIPSVAIFRVGDYGEKGRYSRADLQAMVDEHNASDHVAPVTIDHAESGPAYGEMVKPVRLEGDVLVADIEVHPEFAEIVREGHYKNRSIEIWNDRDSENRPTPGKHSIKAVTFLGAAPPHVKGLPEIDPTSFADQEKPTAIDYAETPDAQEAGAMPNHEEDKSKMQDSDLAAENEALKKRLEEEEALRKAASQEALKMADELKNLQDKVAMMDQEDEKQAASAFSDRLKSAVEKANSIGAPKAVTEVLSRIAGAVYQRKGAKVVKFSDEKPEVALHDAVIEAIGTLGNPALLRPLPTTFHDRNINADPSTDLDSRANKIAAEKNIPYADALRQASKGGA